MKRAEYRKMKRASVLTFKDKLLTLSVTAFLLMSALGYMVIFFGGVFVVDKEKLTLDVTTTIVTEEGDELGKIYYENRDPVKLEDIPEHVLDAYITVEDRRFYEHQGIDYKSIFRAIYRDILARSKVEGGSTITQQLAKNLFFTNDKSWIRKTKEAMAAIYIERHYSKEDILELYLNAIYFGNGAYGIETASQRFFSKSVTDLTIEEGALLAGLAKAPNGYSPVNYPEKALERRNVVLSVMESTGVITTDEHMEAKEKPIELDIPEVEEKPWVDSYLDLVMKEAADKYNLTVDDLRKGGYRIVANIDERAQKAAYERFQNDDYFPGNTTEAEGAFVLKEATTGKVKAAIGGRNYQLGDLNRVNVKRQPGSTFKPVAVYGPALMKDMYSPYFLLPDRQVDSENYEINNHDNQYDDIVSLYAALVESKNTSPTWLLDQIGVDYVKEYLEKMGMTIPDDGLAIALGGLKEGVTPLNMTDAYSAFANHGVMVESTAISEIYDKDDKLIHQADPASHKIFTEQVAWDMTEMLSYTVKYGTASAGHYDGALAGKTGTTQHPLVEGESKDAWFVGYTPNLVSALWIGNDVSDKEHYLTGGSKYPTSLTKDILTDLNESLALGDDFVKPEEAVSLPEPITLPEIADVQGEISFGGGSFIQGKLSWIGSDDPRVIYRVYKERLGIDERIGEVEGETEFTITGFSLLKDSAYYIVPYDPLANMEGKRSETVELSI